MALRLLGYVDLPPHANTGGFDHAAVHAPTGRIYVAHTANDAVDVIDIEARKYMGSIAGLSAVAGALVADPPDVVVTSNRGENTVAVFAPTDAPRIDKIAVGVRPNGLAYDPRRGRVLVAHVGDPAVIGSYTVSIVDLSARKRLVDIPVAGRTRWTIYDTIADAFHVNIAAPPQIVVVGAADPIGIRRAVDVAHAGPHGLDLDTERRRLFCACDAGVVLELDADSGTAVGTEAIAGAPDVVFFNAALGCLYVAIGEPGVIDVFETSPLRRRETIATEAGAHTLSFDATRNIVCAFLPASHRAAVYQDGA
jgi:DNA-binding beta-propeller fold protein YncE